MAVDIGSENVSSSAMWLRPLLNARDDMKGTMCVTQCAPGCKGWYFVYGTEMPLRAHVLEREYIEVLYPYDVIGNASPGELQEAWSSWNLHNFMYKALDVVRQDKLPTCAPYVSYCS